jgi:hypothetical protein
VSRGLKTSNSFIEVRVKRIYSSGRRNKCLILGNYFILVLITKLPLNLVPLNDVTRIFVYGPVPYALGYLYDTLAVFITSYDLLNSYEKRTV